MGAAAELHRVALTHVHHPDRVSVLLAEQGDGAPLLGLLNGHLLGDHVIAGQDSLIDHGADLGELLSGQGGEVGEVEAEPVGLHQGAGLVDMVAQDLAQGGVQQVGGGVGTHDGLTAVGVHLSLDGVSQLEHASGQLAGVHILAALVLLHVSDLEGYAAHAQRAVVGGLAVLSSTTMASTPGISSSACSFSTTMATTLASETVSVS